MDFKNEKFKEVVTRLASEFVQSESNGQSLITITDLRASKDFQKVTIFVTVFPEQKQNAAVDFLKRQRSEFREFVKSRARLSRIPRFDFEIDLGEKARQRVDELV